MPRDSRKVEVGSHWTMAPPVPIDGGFAVQPMFTVEATIHDPDLGPLEVEIEVEIDAGRAYARSVKVAAERDVSSTVLRKVPIRELVAFGLRPALYSVDLTEKGAKLVPLVGPGGRGLDGASIDAIKRLVGYLDDDVIASDNVTVTT